MINFFKNYYPAWTGIVLMSAFLCAACYRSSGSMTDDTETGNKDTGSEIPVDTETEYETDTFNSDHKGKYLRDIMGTGPDDIYAVGTCGLLLHFDGNRWSEIDLGVDDDLNAVWAVAKNNVIVGGGRRSEGSAECEGEDADYVRKGVIHHFNGTQWQEAFGREKDNSQIDSIWGGAPDNIYALGGTHSTSEPDQSGIGHFDGIVWSSVFPDGPQCDFPGDTLTSVRYVNGITSNDFFVIVHYLNLDGGAEMLYRFYGIDECEPIAFSDLPIIDMGPMWIQSSNSIFLLSGYQELGYHFDGLTWTAFECETEFHAFLLDIWGIGENDVYAVGDKGSVIHYNGESWKQMETGIAGNLSGVWGTEEAVYAAGSNDASLSSKDRTPAIYRYDGNSWSRVY